MPDRNDPTRSRNVETELKTIEACKMRAKGFSFQKISEELQKKGHDCCNASAARLLVMRGLKTLREDLKESAEDVRQLELTRLDDILGPQYEVAMTGDPRAAEVCIKLMDRRAKYLGLDNPGSWPTGEDGTPQAPGLNLDAMDVDKLVALAALLKEAQAGAPDGD